MNLVSIKEIYMVSSKCQKYMKQYEERNYAPKVRKLEKNDIQKHCDRSSGRQACESSRSDSLFCSEKVQEKEINEDLNAGSIRPRSVDETIQGSNIQQIPSNEIVLVMQAVSSKPNRRKRKESNPKNVKLKKK